MSNPLETYAREYARKRMQVMHQASLVASAALRDDDDTVGRILRTLPPDELREVAVASVRALAEVIHDHVPPHGIQGGLSAAQQIVTATEGN